MLQQLIWDFWTGNVGELSFASNWLWICHTTFYDGGDISLHTKLRLVYIHMLKLQCQCILITPHWSEKLDGRSFLCHLPLVQVLRTNFCYGEHSTINAKVSIGMH